jgi:protein-tyrosine phosphatase
MFSMFNKKAKYIPPNEFFPEDFVDIHSHLLPGIDDGAKDMEDSLALIRKMHEYGLRDLIVTPHIMAGVYPNDASAIKSKGKNLKAKVEEAGIDVKLRFAAEYMLDEGFLNLLKSGELLTLKDNLVLVEMSYLQAPIHLKKILYELQLKGFIPVLAHPERYAFYHHDFHSYFNLVQRGCKFQLNLLSLSEHYGSSVQKTAIKLLKEGLISFVGTDTHHEGHIQLWKKVATFRNRQLLEEVFEKQKLFVEV